MTVRFRLLGPLQLMVADQVVEIRSARHRALLAALLLRANRFVPSSHLTEVLWGSRPPSSFQATLCSHVMRLRHHLDRHGAPGLLCTKPGGYLMSVDTGAVDLLVFDRLRATADEARQRDDQFGELMALSEATALWQGDVLSNVDSDLLHREEVPSLTECLLAVVERRVEVGMALGRHMELLSELFALTAQHPLRQRFWYQLIQSLCLADRQPEALAAYERMRVLLAERLGMDPGSELRALHMRILKGDGQHAIEPARPRGPAAPESVTSTGPGERACQLPIAVADFVGRDEVAADVTGILAGGLEAAPVLVLHGAPGVGKTALAVRVAYQVRDAFPDGQWFVQLGGSSGAVRSATEVLADLLRYAGMRPPKMPKGEAARAAMLRAFLADRAVLLVLDDAADVSQVQPLLPGTSRSKALVTSRPALQGLAVLYGAAVRPVGPLEPDESALLLRRLIGQRASGDLAHELARLCCHVPLALRIAAASLASQPRRGLADYVASLDRPDRLDRLAVPGDRRVSVRCAIEASYSSLDPGAQELLCALARQPAPSMSACQIGLGLELATEQVTASLGVLVEAGLLETDGCAYSVPDLIRLFAVSLG